MDERMSYPDQTISEYRQRVKELERDLFEARQALFSQGNYLAELEKRMVIAIDEIASTNTECAVKSIMLKASKKQIMFMRQKIECALTCHPNAVKYLLEEALGNHDEN